MHAIVHEGVLHHGRGCVGLLLDALADRYLTAMSDDSTAHESAGEEGGSVEQETLSRTHALYVHPSKGMPRPMRVDVDVDVRCEYTMVHVIGR
jgi:hypothetical protein